MLTRVLQRHIAGLLDWALAKPLWIGGACLLLVVGTWAGYQALGSDLLPEMDEGGFILDYIMPAGSSLSETNRVLEHVERILRATPEVEITSRRTGLQMGLAAVTEANTGDFTVKLKAKRSRSIEDVMEDVRAADQNHRAGTGHRIHAGAAGHDQRPLQCARADPDQDLFQTIRRCWRNLVPGWATPSARFPASWMWRTASTTPSAGRQPTSRWIPSSPRAWASRPLEVSEDATAILDGIADHRSADRQWPPLHHSRAPRRRDPHLARRHPEHGLQQRSGHTASSARWPTLQQLPPQNEIRRENLQRLVVVTGSLEGSDLGTAMAKVQQTVAGLHLPASVRVEYGGTYEEQQKSFRDLLRVLLLALALVFGVLLTEFRNFPAPIAILTSSVLSISGVILALLVTHTTFNVASFMGLIMVIGIVAKNGILLLDADEKFRAEGASAREAMLHAAQRRLRPIVDDRHGRGLRHVAAGLCAGRGLADAAAAGHRRHRRAVHLHGAQPGGHAAGLLPADAQSGEQLGRKNRRFRGSTRRWENRAMSA